MPFFMGCRCCGSPVESAWTTHRLFDTDGTRLLHKDHGSTVYDLCIDDTGHVYLAGSYTGAGQYAGSASIRKLTSSGSQLDYNDDFTNSVSRIIVADSKVYVAARVLRHETATSVTITPSAVPSGLSLSTPPGGSYRALYQSVSLSRTPSFGELAMQLVQNNPSLPSSSKYANTLVSDMTSATIEGELNALCLYGNSVKVQGGPLPSPILVEYFQPSAHPVASGWSISGSFSTARMPGDVHVASYSNTLSRRWFASIDAYIPHPLAHSYPQVAHCIGALSDGRIATIWNMGNYVGGFSGSELNIGYIYNTDGLVDEEIYKRSVVVPAPYTPTSPAQAATVAEDGYIYLAGGNWKLQKLSTSGSVVWQSGVISVGTLGEWTRDIDSVTYGDGYVFVTSDNGRKINKFNASTGSEVTTGGWPFTYGSGAHVAKRILYNSAGLFVAGNPTSAHGLNDTFILNPSDASIILATRYAGGTSTTSNTGYAIAVNDDGTFWIGGTRTTST